MMQFIFDDYIDFAVKDSERIRRRTNISYELADIFPATNGEIISLISKTKENQCEMK